MTVSVEEVEGDGLGNYAEKEMSKLILTCWRPVPDLLCLTNLFSELCSDYLFIMKKLQSYSGRMNSSCLDRQTNKNQQALSKANQKFVFAIEAGLS